MTLARLRRLHASLYVPTTKGLTVRETDMNIKTLKMSLHRAMDKKKMFSHFCEKVEGMVGHAKPSRPASSNEL